MISTPPEKHPWGHHVRAPEGYQAFVPAPLPPELVWNPDLAEHLAKAEWALGRLDGLGMSMPNPHLLTATWTTSAICT